MNTLEIEPNRKNAKGNAFFLGGIGCILFGGMILLAALGKVDYGGPVTWVAIVLLFGWLFGFLFLFSYRLFRLAHLSGPVLIFTPLGLTDRWGQQPKFLGWQDIDYCEWHETSATLVLRIFPKQRSAMDSIRGVFGAHRYQYLAQYLATPANEIAQFMLENAPQSILR